MTTRRGEPFTEWGYSIRYPMQREVAIVGERSGRMDGQQGREAALTRESVEDILRPLVEARVACQNPYHAQSITLGKTCPVCHTAPPGHGTTQDPRFDALRCPPRVYCHEEGIHADLGDIVRAMRAFQSQVLVVWSYDESMRQYACGFMGWYGHGDIPEEAAARALVAAWRDEKARIPTDGMRA